MSDPGAALGMDVKYALTPGLTFTGTVNPDFGQVEADPAVVNLTAFETFFAERRPFFVEGSGTFNFGLDCDDGQCTGLFYSRRIGRSPQGIDDLDSGDDIYTASPVYTSILGAGKLTGRVGRYSIGVMQAFTQEEFARVPDRSVAGARGGRAVHQLHRRPRPPRVREPVVDRRHAHRDQAQHDALAFLPGTALSSGVDWDLRFKTRYSLTGYLVGQRRARRAGGDSADSGEQPALFPAARPDQRVARSDAHVRSAAARAGWASARSAASTSASSRTSASRRRASRSTTSGSCAVPTSGT